MGNAGAYNRAVAILQPIIMRASVNGGPECGPSCGIGNAGDVTIVVFPKW